MYLFLSFLTGVTVVVNMMLNAKVSQKTGQINGIIINYTAAAITSIMLCAIMFKSMSSFSALKGIPLPYFMGGILGVLTTYLFNIIVPRVPSFYVVLLRFIGQMLTSTIIDYLFFHIFSKGKILGSLLFLIGLLVNMRTDYEYKNMEKPKEESPAEA